MADIKPKRLAVWSTPRCLSTAMVMSFGNYGNVEVFNELYAGASVFGPDRQFNIPLPITVENDLSYDEVKSQLEAAYSTRDLVFLKDHASAIYGKYDKLPAGFTHAFIIRNPRKSILSGLRLTEKTGWTAEQFVMTVKTINTNSKGVGFKAIVALVDHVETALGQPAVILDADDLQRDPEKMLRAFCKALDLPFRESLLKWDPITEISWHNSKTILSIHKANGAYENALKSTGWVVTEPKPVDLTGVPQIVLECMEEAMPFYEKLHARRIKPVN